MTDFVGLGGGGGCSGSRGTLAGYLDAFKFARWVKACGENTSALGPPPPSTGWLAGAVAPFRLKTLMAALSNLGIDPPRKGIDTL